jgi:hypothetical protein
VSNPVNNAISVTPTSSTTHNLSLTVSAGTNRVVSVWVAQDTTPTVTGVIFDPSGLNLTIAERVRLVNSAAAAVIVGGYTLALDDSVDAGTYTVRVTMSSATSALTIRARQLAGVVAIPEATDTSEAGTPAALSNTLTVTSGAFIDACACNASAAQTWEWSGGTVTEYDEQDESPFTSSSATGVASGTSVTVTATSSAGSTNKVLCSMAFAPAAAPPAPPSGHIRLLFRAP